MITKSNLPENYTTCKEINFCSNRIINGGHILAIGDVLPLLIGAGSPPRVWLQAVSSPNSKKFIVVLEDSKSKHPSVTVKHFGTQLVVAVQGKTVISVQADGEGVTTVNEIDLRPLGLNVIGTASELTLGGMTLSHNSFSNVGVAFQMGP